MSGTAAAGSPPGGWVLALHSSSEVLGVGLQRLGASHPQRLEAFPLGRALSQQLFACVEAVLPAAAWPSLARLAVATGPGGFTGTRLTVGMARTLAQQLALPLDGVSSFQLAARRLWRRGETPTSGPWWLVQDLPRRGVVAGLYEPDGAVPGGIAERRAPRLHPASDALESWPQLCAAALQPDDVAELLAVAGARAAAGLPAPWAPVLPLYPTSPVGEA
ncbi:MAG: tRNA (adenosine(37)-N6)-threonylcarbamoyltransferase complex dimerization subunit type 1 TsaB [Synechococcaceae cyanobacterium]|nr:tRNA (adenosine(37)-N6)-threonylcarbamoyltransferase complex dimerization subunit type 1 TsaB [Synechococcaceae cyanobacterium]